MSDVVEMRRKEVPQPLELVKGRIGKILPPAVQSEVEPGEEDRPDAVGEHERLLHEPFQDQAQGEADRRTRCRPQIRIGEGPHDLVHGVEAAGAAGVDHRAVDDLNGLGPPAAEPGVTEAGDDVPPRSHPPCTQMLGFACGEVKY